MDFLQCALEYASLGYRVFPLKPLDKTPIVIHGLLEATTNEDQINEWWTNTPNANIGLSTDGLVVIDVDYEDNPWLFEDKERASILSVAPIQITPRGGMHFFFKQPKGANWRNTTSKLAIDVDTRATGGYVVVPPSRVSEDRVYKWKPEYKLDIPPSSLPEPPDIVQDWLNAIARGERFILEAALKQKKIKTGQRNATFTRMAGYMRRAGMNYDLIMAAMIKANETLCENPLDEKELHKIANSISDYTPDQASQIMMWGFPDDDDWLKGPAWPGFFPQELVDEAPGLMRDIIDHVIRTSARPQPVFALASTLSLMSVLTGRKIQDETGLQTNLYTIALGESATGKEQGRRINKQIVLAAKYRNVMGPESIKSSSAIVNHVEKKPCILFQIDEISKFLQTTHSAKAAPHLYDISRVLLTFFSCAGQIYEGDAFAEVEKTKTINWPHVAIYGTCTPEDFYGSLTKKSLNDGFVARFLIFETDTRLPQLQRKRAIDIPPSIVSRVEEWKKFRPNGLVGTEFPQPKVVPFTLGATDILDNLQQSCESEWHRDQNSESRSIWLRVHEHAAKLAMLHAAAKDGPEIEQVDSESVRWGARLSEYLARRLIFSADQYMAESKPEANLKKVLRLISRAENCEMSRNELSRRTQHMTQKERNDCITHLLETNQIETTTRETKGRPAMMYKLKEAI